MPIVENSLHRAPLPPLAFEPRDYQDAFHGDALRWLDDDENQDRPRGRLYSAPCGSGKSLMELRLLAHLGEAAVLTTPRLEIVAGMLDKVGVACSDWSDQKLRNAAARYGVFTPITLRNLLARGELPYRPRYWIADEAHHAPAETYELIHTYLGPYTLRVGLTATPFRGTPAQTRDFVEAWGGEVVEILDVRQAAARGIVAVPRGEVWPLVDDEELAVVNGEFEIHQSVVAAEGAAEAIAATAYDRGWNAGGTWDKGTVFAVPSVGTARYLAGELNRRRTTAYAVTGETPRAERNAVFAMFRDREAAIVQVDVISEGVDLPVGRIVDARPTLSPVRWFQQVGRLRVAGGGAPEYIACNRNLERFCYLYDGVLPPEAARATAEAFGAEDLGHRVGASATRAAARVLNLTDIGRFVPGRVHWSDGTVGAVFCVVRVNEFTREEFALVTHPSFAEVLAARRESKKKSDGTLTWGRWRRTDDIPTDFRGFASAPAKTITPKMAAWWEKDARRFGLDPLHTPDRREFAVLPVLADCGGRPRSWLR